MCRICGQPDYVRCNCISQQPFCDNCAEDTKCVTKTDAECVVYHFNSPNKASKLNCLGLDNNVSLETFMEAVDDKLCTIENEGTPLKVTDTASVNLTATGLANHTLQADVNISADEGNTLVIREDGLFSSGSTGDFTCEGVEEVFENDTNQKNTVVQTRYDFLISGLDGCQKVSPPTGFAVTGSTRISAFGSMEWYSTLALANDAAQGGETVLIFNDTAEDLTLKNNVAYTGIGFKSIGNITGNTTTNNITNLKFIVGSFILSDITFTNVDFTGNVTVEESMINGGRYLNQAASLSITENSLVRNISAYREVMMTGACSTFLDSYVYTTRADGEVAALTHTNTTTTPSIIHNVKVFAPNKTAVYSLGSCIMTSSEGISEDGNGIYFHLGGEVNFNTGMISSCTGKSIDGNGIHMYRNGLYSDTASNTNMNNGGNTGYSVNGAGIALTGSNIKNSSGYSVNGSGIQVLSGDQAYFNCRVIECIGESTNLNGLRASTDINIVGGTYISRNSGSIGSPIYLSDGDPAKPIKNYFVADVTTIQRSTTAFAIKGDPAGPVTAKIVGNKFLSEVTTTVTNTIDTSNITLLAYAVDAYGNIK